MRIIRILIAWISWQSYIVHVIAFQRWSMWHQTCRHTRIQHCGQVLLPSKHQLCQTPTGRLVLPSQLISLHRFSRMARSGLWWVSLLGLNTEIGDTQTERGQIEVKIKSYVSTPWRHMAEWRCSFTHSWPWQKMEVSDQCIPHPTPQPPLHYHLTEGCMGLRAVMHALKQRKSCTHTGNQSILS